MRLLAAAILILQVSCVSSPAGPEPSGGTLTLRFGETAAVGRMRVSFTDIVDSRCPKEVVCAWEGDAAVRLESGGNSLVLHTNQTAGAASGELAGVTMTLLEVKPGPAAPNEAKKTDYVATIRLSE